jgi:hypothetical protein
MEVLQRQILFDLIPSYSREVHVSGDVENIKSLTMQFMKDVAHLVFPNEKIVLNDLNTNP